MIKFYRGPKVNYTYTPDGKFKDAIFFATDTQELYLNGKIYGDGNDKTKKVADVNQKQGDSSKIIITYTDRSTKEVTVGKSTYTSNIENTSLTMPNAVGGIGKGTKVSELNGRTYDQMFDDLLFPTIQPTHTEPSLKITAPTIKVLEVGSNGFFANDFKYKYDAGIIYLNGVISGVYTGPPTGNSSVYWGGDPANTLLPAQVALGNTTFTVAVDYGAGDQPKDNKGNNATSFARNNGGTIKQNIVINGTLPYFATTSESGTLTKQPLLTWTINNMQTPELTLKPVGSGSQSFKIPRTKKGITMLNTLTGKHEADTSPWTETEVTETINDVDYTYYQYTYSGSSRGEVKIKVTF